MKKCVLLSLLTTQLMCMTMAQQKKVRSKPVAANSNNELIIKTMNGSVQGVLEKSGIRSFKGIPFAAPPVGNLRWKEPHPVTNWTGVLKADHFGPRAMQPPIFSDMNFRSNGMSEDCLYLNVWAPARRPRMLMPVLVYFYGGGFIAGDGSEPRYDGENMAKEGIVAITVNYRLGVFGFMSHPELTKESPHHASGNYGLLDQMAALQWVQKNIAAFGGDPKRVTIAGESAGSISVSAQMASPLSKKLIAGAIGESGSILGALSAVPLSEGEQTGVQFAQTAGASSLAALRAMPADSILSVAGKFGPFRFARTIDGYFFPKSPYAIFEAGEQAHVPLLVGWNSEEMNYRAILGNDKPTRKSFEKAVKRLYGNKADDVLKVYKVTKEVNAEQVATDLASDRFIAFSTWKWATVHAKTGGAPVYRYYYERPRPALAADANPSAGVQASAKSKMPVAKGAVHSAEIEYAMGNLATNTVYAWTEKDYKVSRIMQAYFAAFIKSGDPNDANLSLWPAVSNKGNVSVMHINVLPRVEADQHRERYEVLERGLNAER